MKLAPSILSANFLNLKEDLMVLKQFSIDVLHLDIMDGHFVPNLTFGAPLIKDIKPFWSGHLEAHLMVLNPDTLIEAMVKAGVTRIIIHQEVCSHLHRSIDLIKSYGIEAGVVLNPATPLNTITDILEFLDIVLLMTVNPGFGGQSYLSFVNKKIQELAKFKAKYNFLIEVDGGIKQEHLKSLAAMSVDLCVVGSAIFNQKPVTENLKELLA